MSESLTFHLPKKSSVVQTRSRLYIAREINVLCERTAYLPYVQLRMMDLLTNKSYLAL